MADNNHVLQLTAAQLDETLRKVPELEVTVGRLSEDIGDIRVGYDGTVYGTAGEAVRMQVRGIVNTIGGIIDTSLSDLMDIKEYGEPIFLDSTGTVSGYISGDGTLVKSGTWEAYKFDLSDVVLNRYEAYSNQTAMLAVAFYSSLTDISANTFISGINFTSTTGKSIFEDIETPIGAVCAVVSNRNATATDIVIEGFVYLGEDVDNTIKGRLKNAESKISALEETDAILRAEINELKEISEPTVVNLLTPDNLYGNYYIRANGFLQESGSWETYIAKPNYVRYIFNCVSNDIVNIKNIAFYSSDKPSANSYIGGISVSNHSTFEELVITQDDIPKGTLTILFCSRTATGAGTALVAVDTVKNQVNEIAEIVNQLSNDTFGRGNVKAIYTNIPNSNDFTVIKDEVWFAQNIYRDGVATEYTTIHRYKIVDGRLVFVSTIDSDFGHWNCVDYCEENDCLIFTNAANLENTEGNYFTVVKNPLALGTYARIADCGIKYKTDYGFKIQAVWGDNNFGRYNIVYLTSNHTQNIYKLMLRRDANGDFVRDANGFGSFVELETATSEEVIFTGGGDFWGDTLYIGNGGGYGYYEMSMSDYRIKQIKRRYYYDDGTEYSGSTQGVHVDSDYIWVFSNIAGLTDNFLIQYHR